MAGEHKWVGAFTARLDDEQAATYARKIDAKKGSGRPPKLDWPGRVEDVYCATCRRSYGRCSDECEPMPTRNRLFNVERTAV